MSKVPIYRNQSNDLQSIVFCSPSVRWHGFCNHNHSLFYFFRLSQSKIPSFCRWFLSITPGLVIHLKVVFSIRKWKVVLIAVFLRKLDHRPLFNHIYYETILVWGLVSIWLTTPHTAYSIHHVKSVKSVHNHCFVTKS